MKSPIRQVRKPESKKKELRMHTEISLETLEILLTSIPEENSLSHPSDISVEYDKEKQAKNIKNFISHKKHYQKRVTHLIKRKRGAEWLVRNLAYFHTHFPWELISLLESMVYEDTIESSYQQEKPAPFSEQQPCLQSNDNSNKPEGLRVITSNIRRLVYDNLEKPLQELNPELIDTCSSDALNEWNIWCEGIELHIKNIESLLYDGQCFFSLKNFELMEQLSISKKSKVILRNIINNVSSS